MYLMHYWNRHVLSHFVLNVSLTRYIVKITCPKYLNKEAKFNVVSPNVISLARFAFLEYMIRDLETLY